MKYTVEVRPNYTGRVFTATVEADSHADAVKKVAETADQWASERPPSVPANHGPWPWENREA